MSDITAKINRIEELVEQLNRASEAYYNGQDEIMSNYEWDAMFDELSGLEEETDTSFPTVQHRMQDMKKVRVGKEKRMNTRRFHLQRQKKWKNS